MNFELTEEQLAVKAAARDFAQTEYLYHTDFFRQQLEKVAKANLQAV